MICLLTRRRLLAVLVGFALVFGCDSDPTSSSEASEEEDVQFLADELARRHRNAFAHITREAFMDSSEALKARVPALDRYGVAVGMMQLGALLRDAHTGVSPWEQLRFHTFPVQLQWFDDGLFVVSATAARSDLLAARLVHVHGKPLEEVARRLRTVVSYENDAWFRRTAPKLLSTAELLNVLGIIPERNRALFSFTTAGGGSVEVELQISSQAPRFIPALEGDQLPLYLRDLRRYYWFEYLEGHHALYVNYNRCANIDGYSFAAFARDLFAFADDHTVERLIVDLRMNLGGNSSVMRPLVDGLEQRPHLWENGRLFVLTGMSTFSSGVLNAIELETSFDAVLAREPTGGAPNGYGEVRTFTLPLTGYEVFYSTKYFHPLDTDEPTLHPDMSIPLSSSEFFAGRDPVLDAVLSE